MVHRKGLLSRMRRLAGDAAGLRMDITTYNELVRKNDDTEIGGEWVIEALNRIEAFLESAAREAEENPKRAAD